ncbi:HD-GYP domain-containing protein [Deferribacteres bacterium DY0037]|nr:HD-GYP domain-containing protein [Denitrovibrio acetiphilus]
MKKIAVKDLKVGDKILRLDKSWFETSFFKHKFIVKDKSVIDRIMSSNIEFVYIDEVTPEEIKVSQILETPTKDIIDEAAEAASVNLIDIEDFSKASEVYTESVKMTKCVFEDIRAGKMFNNCAVKSIAANIAQITRRNKGVLASVTKLRQYDDYTFQHSMNVSIYSAGLASHLGMDSNEVERIACAGLLHDVGKMLVPKDILNKPGKLTDEEFSMMRNHVQYGYDFLRKEAVADDILRLAYEHHERYDGSGYPNRLRDKDISIEGKIGAVVDIYDAITSDRVYHKGMEPPSALKLMFKWADSYINKKVFEFFIMNIGIYPVGTLVLMNTHELGIVGKTNINKPTEPLVLVFMNKKGRRLPVKVVDLSIKTVVKRKILAPINPESVSVPDEVYSYIDNLNKIT